MSRLYVATVAIDNAWADIPANIASTKEHTQKVKELFPETQIILFPEMSLTGYILDESSQALAEPMDGQTVESIQEIAAQNDVAIIASLIGKGKNKPYNTAFVAGSNGTLITHYNKNHLFTQSTEPEFYAPGNELSIFEIEGWRCGLSTCFDIRFPRLFETYKKAEVECMFSPFNWVAGRNKANLFDCLVKARAHENQFFFVAVDRSGKDPNASYHGISVIANPFGENIAERNSLYSYAVLDRNEIATLSRALPLHESYKESYTLIK